MIKVSVLLNMIGYNLNHVYSQNILNELHYIIEILMISNSFTCVLVSAHRNNRPPSVSIIEALSSADDNTTRFPEACVPRSSTPMPLPSTSGAIQQRTPALPSYSDFQAKRTTSRKRRQKKRRSQSKKKLPISRIYESSTD